MATTIQQIELPKKARAVDTSGNNNHGQIYSGRGLEFDGIADCLTGLPSPTAQMTISLWVYASSSAIGGLVTWDESGGNHDYDFVLYRSGGKIVAKWDTDTLETTVTGNYSLLENTWHRVVAVQSSDTFKIYINGQLDISSSITAHLSGSRVGAVGRMYANVYSSENFFDGKMSDVQVWDTTWSAADVTYDYLNPESLALNNSGTALTESNLKLWYPMQDGHRGQQSYILDGANTGLGDEISPQLNFDTDEISSWAGYSDTFAFDTDHYVLSRESSDARRRRVISPVPTVGVTYKVSVTAKKVSGSGTTVKMGLTNSADSQDNLTNFSPTSEFQTYTTYVTATSTTTHAVLWVGSPNTVIHYKSLSIKAINDKHHATTVFYGDELWDGTQGDDDNWSLFGNNTKAEDAGAVKITYVDNAAGGYIMLRNATDLNADLVVGRTYIISFSTKVNQGSIAWRSLTAGMGGGINATATAITSTSFETRTMTVVANHATDLYIHSNLMATGDIVWIKDISVKEVGVASGWTDADQQLHIPQTALQSYNELAWFDGTIASDGYVDLDSAITTSGNSWSLSFWVFHDDNGQAFDFIAGNGANQIITLKNNTTDRLSYRDNGNTYHALSDAAIPESEWVNITITAIANTSITAYVNGVAQETNSTMTNTTLLLKKFMRGYASNLYHVLGTINEISYYSDVLTSAEALDLFNDGKAKSALEASGSAGLVGYWRNNGLSEWKDLKGSNDGNTTAGVVETILIPQGVDSTRDAQGFIMNKQKSTSCLNFPTRSGDYAEVLDYGDLDFGTGDFSYECWAQYGFINNSDIGGAFASGLNVVFSNGHASSSNTTGFNLLTNSSKFLARIGDGAKEDSLNIQNRDDDGDAVDYVVGDWYHIAVTRTGTTLRSYVDGAPSNYMTNMESDISVSTDTPFRISDDTVGSRDYKWPVDGVRLYSKELSDTEVLKNYKATKGNHRN